ncbi:response regulator transcription factor [Labedaea rhizosphaerae]|uniref:Regulatory LuxR family protein n=1 Tax=Labedaea rhizosphaerae TaxID=598644 RepID=A0A4R6S7Z4_LABRH|nr:response regulator transcription factor [Labedaea rhizosphaerae]TDP94945.1 regulatory LuxR family protein [Labedaea rhizosphaerae]
MVRSQARDAVLDAEAVEAVLRAAGHQVRRRAPYPAGLTAREVEVLRLVAGGRANREIARLLSISEKTVRNHVEHIYTKAGVTNRTGAGLFALSNGLTGAFPPER